MKKNEQRIDDLHIICPKCKDDKFYRSFGGNYTFKCVNCGYKIGKKPEDGNELAKGKYNPANGTMKCACKCHEDNCIACSECNINHLVKKIYK